MSFRTLIFSCTCPVYFLLKFSNSFIYFSQLYLIIRFLYCLHFCVKVCTHYLKSTHLYLQFCTLLYVSSYRTEI